MEPLCEIQGDVHATGQPAGKGSGCVRGNIQKTAFRGPQGRRSLEATYRLADRPWC